jgi:hypothetical protein
LTAGAGMRRKARLRRSARRVPPPLGAAADEDRVLAALGGDQPDPRPTVFDEAVHAEVRKLATASQ